MLVLKDDLTVNLNQYSRFTLSGSSISFACDDDKIEFTFSTDERAKIVYTEILNALKRGDEFFDCDAPF